MSRRSGELANALGEGFADGLDVARLLTMDSRRTRDFEITA